MRIVSAKSFILGGELPLLRRANRHAAMGPEMFFSNDGGELGSEASSCGIIFLMQDVGGK